jgi:alpha-tubulin suppressor-like RCC1 family protein
LRWIRHAERIMMMEEELGELESRANSLLSEFGKRGGVPKVTRVDAPHSKFVAAGGFHSAALDDEGLMWTWGRNTEGQLGLGDTAKKRDFFEPQIVSLDAVNGKHMRLVTCGVRVSAAVDENGSLWTWGDGKGFLSHEDIHLPQLGGSYDVAVPRLIKWPASVDSNIRVAAVSLGWSHTVVLDESGNIYTWGYGGNGRLGHGDEQTRLGPARVQGVPPHEMAAVAAGGAFTVARSKSGLALAWGAGHCSGQGEYGSHEDLLTPEIIPLSKGMDVTAVAAGGLHAALLTRDGGAYTWGWGECGQLGLGLRGMAEVIREPTQVDTENQKITMVACGAYHTALVEEGGELMTFGAGGKRRVATTTEDDERGGSSTAGSSRPGSKQGARLSQSKGSARHSHSSKAGPGPGPGGEDDPGVKRDKQGFTKEEREAFNLELAGRAMNLKSLTGTDNKKVTTQDGYQDYVIRRREKVGLDTTFHHVILHSQNTVQLMTASMVHVTNRVTPGSECNPTRRFPTAPWSSRSI